MKMSPPTYGPQISKRDFSTESRELEKADRVSIRSPKHPTRSIVYPRPASQSDVLNNDVFFWHGEVGYIINKRTFSNEVLYLVEVSRGVKGWVSLKYIEKYNAAHSSGNGNKFPPAETGGCSGESSSSLTTLIDNLEKHKHQAVALQDFVRAQKIKEQILALKEKSNDINDIQNHTSKPLDDVPVIGTAVDAIKPQKCQDVSPLVVAQEIKEVNDISEQHSSIDPLVSFDDGLSWQVFPANKVKKGRRSRVLNRGVVVNLGFGSFSITESMGGRQSLESHGFQLEYCKLTPKETRKYDHHIYETHARKNLYDYAREKLVPFIRRLAKGGRCPVALIAGSRGGQETLQYIWRHCYRGPTVCLNASCIATSGAELHAYRGVNYTMANAPRRIPLVVTTSDNDEVGFRPELGRELFQLYRGPGHEHLITQYHCSSDSHVPESVPSRLGMLVRVAVGQSTCRDIWGVSALASARQLVKSCTKNSYVIVGGVKIR